MKILYGVQATGNGHITRSRVMIQKLKERGHDVNVIISGREESKLWDMEDFKPYQVFKGLSFETSKGKIDYVKTVAKLDAPRFYWDALTFDAKDTELVITDFEPITSIVAQKKGLPSIGLGHQYAFHYDIPMNKYDIIATNVLKLFAPARVNIGLHWNDFGGTILPPIIPELEKPKKVFNDKITVYLPWEEQSKVGAFLKQFKDYQFHIYSDVKEDKTEGNLHWHPFSRTNFPKDLASSLGIICNAGFELPSEALGAGKKVLAKPIRGQMEQASNGVVLEKLGLGYVMKSLDKVIVDDWLASQPPKPIKYLSNTEPIVKWIERQDWKDTDSLVEDCWK